MARRALGHAARVDEDQRRPVRRHEFDDARVDLVPLRDGHHRRERRRRHLEREVALFRVADVDDLALRDAIDHAMCAHEEARDLGDRLLRRRQADARDAAQHARRRRFEHAVLVRRVEQRRARRVVRERLQPLERQREVAAALVGGERVDLVDDHRAHRRQHPPARQRAEQHVERLGRRDQDVRWAAQVAPAILLRRVAGAHRGADVDVGQAEFGQLGADAGQRRLEVGADVVRQRLQRRHVDDRGLVRQAALLDAAAHQIVERGQEGGERLARTGRGGDQRVAPGADRWPRRDLRLGRRGELALEPARDGGVEVLQGHGVWSGGRAGVSTRRMQIGADGRISSRGPILPARAAGVQAPAFHARRQSMRTRREPCRQRGITSAGTIRRGPMRGRTTSCKRACR